MSWNPNRYDCPHCLQPDCRYLNEWGCQNIEVNRLKMLLDLRDAFIVSQGLWQKFVNQLA